MCTMWFIRNRQGFQIGHTLHSPLVDNIVWHLWVPRLGGCHVESLQQHKTNFSPESPPMIKSILSGECILVSPVASHHQSCFVACLYNGWRFCTIVADTGQFRYPWVGSFEKLWDWPSSFCWKQWSHFESQCWNTLSSSKTPILYLQRWMKNCENFVPSTCIFATMLCKKWIGDQFSYQVIILLV